MLYYIMNKRYRNVCFTVFAENEKSILRSNSEVGGNTIPLPLQYCVYGIEICPDTKKEHY